MSREQHLAELERLLAQIREGAADDAVSSRPPVGSPEPWAGPSGAQYHQSVLRPPVVPSVASVPPYMQPVLNSNGQVVGWVPQPNKPDKVESRGLDPMAQRMVGGGVLLTGGGVGGALLLHAAATAVVPLALIAIIAVSLTYLKMSHKSGGGSGGANVNVNVSIRTNQRNG